MVLKKCESENTMQILLGLKITFLENKCSKTSDLFFFYKNTFAFIRNCVNFCITFDRWNYDWNKLFKMFFLWKNRLIFVLISTVYRILEGRRDSRKTIVDKINTKLKVITVRKNQWKLKIQRIFADWVE